MQSNEVVDWLARFDAQRAPYEATAQAHHEELANLATTLRGWVATSSFRSLVERAQYGELVTFEDLCDSLRAYPEFDVSPLNDDPTKRVLATFVQHVPQGTPPIGASIGADIRTMDEVRSRIGPAMAVVGLQILATTALSLFGLFGGGLEGEYAALADPWNLLDAGLLVVFAVGLGFRSRVAVGCLIGYFVLSRLLFILDGVTSGMIVSIFVLVIYARAFAACFAHHRLMSKSVPGYRPSPVPAVIAIVGGVVLAPCLFLTAILGAAGVPVDVVPGPELQQDLVVQLSELEIVEDGEAIEAVYFDGLFDARTGGVVLTDRRLVQWEDDLDGRIVKSITVRDDIVHVSTTGDTINVDTKLGSETLVFDDALNAQRFAKHLNRNQR